MDAVAIYVGGRTGPQAKAGQPIMEMVPCDEALPDVLAVVVKHLDLFKQVEPQPGIKDRVLMVPAYGDDEAGDNGHGLQRVAGMTANGEDIVDTVRSCPFLAATTRGVETMTTSRTVKVRACEVKELAEGVGKAVTVGGKSLALFRAGERVVAMDAECPHEGGPLQDGTIEDGCVVCPWHNYKFALADGRCDLDPSLSAKVYPTLVDTGAVYVELGVSGVASDK